MKRKAHEEEKEEEETKCWIMKKRAERDWERPGAGG
jgi:hypothetical protein